MPLPSPVPPYPGLTIESDQTVWSGRFPVQVIQFRQRRFDGAPSETRTWELWRRGRAGAVLPYDPVADKVVLIEQFRLPALAAGVDPIMVEVPAGLCDGTEDPADTVRREAVEEMGLETTTLELIGDFVLTPGGCDERCTLYAGRITAPQGDADGLVGTAGLASEHEDIQIRVRPAEDAIADAIAGRFPNSVTTIALLWLAAKRPWLRAHWTAA